MNAKELSEQINDPYYKSVFEILSHDGDKSIVGDSAVGMSHTMDTIEELQTLTYTETQARYAKAGVAFKTQDELVKELAPVLTGDAIYNSETGVGFVNDPMVYTRSAVPCMLGPQEQSGLYANGGLSQIIIDKKSGGLVSNGVTFMTFDKDFWDHSKIQMLEEAAELSGYNSALAENIRDTLVYGGSVLYPVFKNDSMISFQRPLEQMNLDKECISRWINADRWNTVVVPSYNITAEDYLYPKTIYMPLGGCTVSTSRCSLTKPKLMPYWAAMYNIGWSPSDYSGFLRALYGYQMICMSMPIMAQQMSLLANRIPLDSLTASLGKDSVLKLIEKSEQSMREWSMLNPKAMNTVGELTTVDRTFSGYDMFVGEAKSFLASSCGITEPSLFHTPNKGFSDNTQESLLKDSESMKILQRVIEPQLVHHTDVLVAHVWGTDSEEWKQRRKVWISFDKPIVSTEKDMAEIGARFSATIASMSTHMPTHIAVDLAKQFFTNVDIDDKISNGILEYDTWQRKLEEENLKMQKQSNVDKNEKSGAGHSIASVGNAMNTGKFTKPQK